MEGQSIVEEQNTEPFGQTRERRQQKLLKMAYNSDEEERIGAEEQSSEEKGQPVNNDGVTTETNEATADYKRPLHLTSTREEEEEEGDDNEDISLSSNQDDSLATKPSANGDDGNVNSQMPSQSSDPPGKSPLQLKTVKPDNQVPLQNTKKKYLKRPVTFTPSGTDPTLRIQAHDQLLRFESKRRLEMSVQLDIQQERWNAAKEIVRQAVRNVESVERLVIGFAKAGILFAGNLKATSEDKFIDQKGEVARKTYTQNRLSKQRDVAAAMDTGSAIFSVIINCQAVLANQAKSFEDNSQQMLGVVLPKLVELKADVKSQAKEIETLGESIMEDMKQSENDVGTIWNALDTLVNNDIMEQSAHGSMHGSMHGSTHGGSVHGGSMHGGDGIRRGVNFRRRGIIKQMRGVKDGWLVSQFYKVASSYQKAVAGFTKDELDKLIKRIVEMEENRSTALQSLLTEGFLRRQSQLFASIPNFDTSLVKKLEDFQIDTESLEAVLDDRCLERLKQSQSHRSSIMNRRSLLTGITDSQEVANIADEFGDPFHNSKKILMSKVVELKKSGGLGGMVAATWTTALFMVTNYGLLHIIELPKEKLVPTDASPVAAFQALNPDSKFDSTVEWTNGRKRGIVQTLTPVISLHFIQCSFDLGKMHRREIILTEDVGQKPRNRFFKGNAGVKSTLRLASGNKSSEWIETLKETKKDLIAGPKKKEPESKEADRQAEK